MNKTKRRIFLIPPDQKILLTEQKEITELCEILRELVIYRQDDRTPYSACFYAVLSVYAVHFFVY